MLTRANLAARTARGFNAAPVGIVHLGMGAFHRAHQAVYTARARDAGEWGIAGFTGRTPTAARDLSRQDGLYTLVQRGPDDDDAEIISSISTCVDGADAAAIAVHLAAAATRVVTLTVTEAAYRLDHRGILRLDDPAVAEDVALVRKAASARSGEVGRAPSTPLGRLALGLVERRRADSGPLAIVPCDNLLFGGEIVGAALNRFLDAVDEAVATAVSSSIEMISTSVDRITPATDVGVVRTAHARTGFLDVVPVVTEPYSSWVLSGRFPSGRPAWEDAGAEFVDDVQPYQLRKLWMLNGAHSLLAYAGLVRGHVTVADAIDDDALRNWTIDLWQDVGAVLAGRFTPGELDDYRAALVARFQNARMRDELSRIAVDGTAKLRARVAPVVFASIERGFTPVGQYRALAAWIAAVRAGLLVADAQLSEVLAAGGSADRLLAVIHPHLADVDALVTDVDALARSVASEAFRPDPTHPF